MKLSTRTRYGTRALIELALQYHSGQPVMLQSIADKQNISKKYLEQLFILLKESNIIKSVRGPTGGYLLSRPPAQIALREIVEVLEGSLALVECLEDEGFCSKIETCVTRQLWKSIADEIRKILEGISLEDMSHRHIELLSTSS